MSAPSSRVLVWRLLTLSLMASVLLGVPPLTAGPAGAVGPYCGALPGLTANVWQGMGVGPGTSAEWAEDSNWSSGTSPVTGDQYVCIPSGGTPSITDTGVVHQIAAMDVAVGATLTVGLGTKVVVHGDQSSQASTIRGRLEVRGAGFGGDARLDILGSMLVKSLGVGESASLFTRLCRYYPVPPNPYPSYPGEEACFGPDGPDANTDPDPRPATGTLGLIEVANSGVLDIEGGGVNLGDQFQLGVRGLLRFRNGGYLAADHGSTITLRPHLPNAPGTGTLRIANDGGIAEGFIESDNGIAGLATVVNGGLIEKTGGAGVSLISADYSQSAAGRVRVDSGTLLLPQGPARAAAVGPGDTYGTGRCFDPTAAACRPSTFEGNLQNAQVRVPKSDRNGAAVVVRKLTGSAPGNNLGQPFRAHAKKLRATRSDPAILTLRIDERLLQGRSWKSVKVLRKAVGSTSYVRVPRCLSGGKPPAGKAACVDRRKRALSSRNVKDNDFGGNKPDVIMVIRTTETSRWICR